MAVKSVLKITDSYSQNITLSDGSKYLLFLWIDPFLGTDSIFLQRFGKQAGEVINLNIPNCDRKNTYYAQIAPFANGDYIVILDEVDSYRKTTLFFQRFNAVNVKMGRLIQWDKVGHNRDNYRPFITTLSKGNIVIVFMGETSLYEFTLFIHQFNIDGSALKERTELKLPGKIIGSTLPQITVLKEGGYILTWQGIDLRNDFCMFLQKFNTDGVEVGKIVRFDSPLNPVYDDLDTKYWIPKITTHPDGGYIVSFFEITSI